MVLWLKLPVPPQGTQVWSLVGELRCLRPLSTTKKERESSIPGIPFFTSSPSILRTKILTWGQMLLAPIYKGPRSLRQLISKLPWEPGVRSPCILYGAEQIDVFYLGDPLTIVLPAVTWLDKLIISVSMEAHLPVNLFQLWSPSFEYNPCWSLS